MMNYEIVHNASIRENDDIYTMPAYLAESDYILNMTAYLADSYQSSLHFAPHRPD